MADAPPLQIAAVIAAAGRSRRMGQPKQLLPWHGTTVIATVVRTLHTAGAGPILCVAGHRAGELQDALRAEPVDLIYNEEHLIGEMLSSFQTGIKHLQQGGAELPGALLALGDQPHLTVTQLSRILDAARAQPENILFPSYGRRRGHPFYLPARFWPGLLALTAEETMRTLIRRHEDAIAYVTMPDDAVLRDMDTPADYESLRRRHETNPTDSSPLP